MEEHPEVLNKFETEKPEIDSQKANIGEEKANIDLQKVNIEEEKVNIEDVNLWEEKTMEKSICELICDNITDDTLNPDFRIEDSTEEIGEIHWAPGALDGVTIYHMAPSNLDAEGASEMADAVKCASEGDDQEADNRFAQWCKEHRAVSNIDRLQNYVMEHADQLNAHNIGTTALRLIMCSEHIECVKIGLELLELFGEPVEDIKDVIRTVGLYDEFTIFAVWNMQKWTNGNEEIFHLAKKTNGWGRIHAVERLEPETDEIRKWLLTEGTKNSVQNAYSALTCWKKSNAEKLLQGEISDEEFCGIATIIEGLLDEGPVSGISEVENSQAILRRFLRQAKKHEQAADIVRLVKDWLQNE
jgi:hypothetical protein